MPKAKSQLDMGYDDLIPELQLPNNFSVYYFSDYNFKTSLPHLHHIFEFMLVLHGEVSVAAEATLYPVPAGSMIVMPPNQTHCTILSSTEQLYERQILHLTPNLLHALLEKSGCSWQSWFSAPVVVHCSAKDTAEFREFIEKMMAEDINLRAGDSFSRPIIDSLITTFLLQCGRKLASSPPQTVSDTSLVVGQLIRYIDDHFIEPDLSIRELTEQTYISAGHLNRLLKHNGGEPV
jgi:hypothetical protein